MKSVFPSTKFKPHAQERLGQKRLKAPLNGDSQSGWQATKLLGHLDQLSKPRARLYSSPISAPPHYRLPEIPRYIFVGNQPGESEIRLGIFAGLRGEDNVGAKAIVEFIDDLVAIPSLGSAFRIYAYPTANPLGYYTTRHRANKRIAASPMRLGTNVTFPDVLIEREIFVVQFHGLVVIHTTDESEGLQAAIDGANLRETLVSPILSSLRPLFPTTELAALNSSFSLTAGAVLKQIPFELALHIPRSGWHGLYSIGIRIALHTVVERFRTYSAQANNI
jgi:hypothetical protein